jgi:hypothetical protein
MLIICNDENFCALKFGKFNQVLLWKQAKIYKNVRIREKYQNKC